MMVQVIDIYMYVCVCCNLHLSASCIAVSAVNTNNTYWHKCYYRSAITCYVFVHRVNYVVCQDHNFSFHFMSSPLFVVVFSAGNLSILVHSISAAFLQRAIKIQSTWIKNGDHG